MNNQKYMKRGLTVLALSLGFAVAPVTNAALVSYSQNWESADPATDAEIGDGYVIGNVNVTTGGAWFAGTPAPNSPVAGVNGYSAFVTGEGGDDQGNVQLSVFSDYNSWSPFTTPGTTLQTFVYRDMGFIGAEDLNQTFTFSFDGKIGGLDVGAGSSAWAYVNVLDSVGGTYATLFNGQFDSSTFTSEWNRGSVNVTIDPTWEGQLLQIGFATEATDWAGTGVFYDNLDFAPVPVPAAVWLFGSGLIGLIGVARRRSA